MRIVLLFLGVASFLRAQSGLSAPQIGFVTDGNHSMRPLQGLAGNFLLGESVGEDCLASGSSGLYAMVKTSTSVLVLDSQGQILFAMDAEDGPALFAFSAQGSPGLVFLPDSGLLLIWRDGRLDRLPVNPDRLNGKAISIASIVASEARFLVERPDGVWHVVISTATGELTRQEALPGVRSPALLTGSGELFWIDGQTLMMRDRSLDLGFTAAAIEVLGAGWLQVTEQDSARRFAVRTTLGRERLYQLPEAAQ